MELTPVVLDISGPDSSAAPDDYRPTEELSAEDRDLYNMREFEQVDIPLAKLYYDGGLQLPEWLPKYGFQITIRPAGVTLRAGGFVGLFPINGRVSINVRPRVSISNLTHMLARTESLPVSLEGAARGYSSDDVVWPQLLDVYADACIAEGKQLLELGLFSSYQQRKRSTSFPKGRVLIGQTLAQLTARGLDHRAVCEWSELTTDNAVNQCIKYGLWSLGQHYRGLESRRQGTSRRLREINRILNLLAGIRLDRSLSFLNDDFVTAPALLPARWQAYANLIAICRSVIQQRGIRVESFGEEVFLSSLIVDTSSVFEQYIRYCLRAHLGSGSGLVMLDGNQGMPSGAKRPLFDEGSTSNHYATPDAVLYSVLPPEFRHEAVIEVKYKDRPNPSREDINQALVYGMCYSTDVVVLVLPAVTERDGRGPSLVGTMNGMRLYSYAFNLGAASLEGEERAFARAMTDLVRA
jgi:5-methylcytosine-specific restriction enzyme subunit McrC